MLNIDDELRSTTEAFATDLADLIRRVALESVSAALAGTASIAVAPVHDRGAAPKPSVRDGGSAPKPPVEVAVKRGRGRPKKAPPPAPATKAPAATKAPLKKPAAPPSKSAPKKPAAPKRPFGAKRPPSELAKLTERLAEYIKAHPGLRMEAIGKALGAPTKDLSFPLKKLLLAKKIRSQGHKRATEYFAA